MTTSVEPPVNPPPRANSRFMLTHPAHILAFGFGSGLARYMPGTFGTLFAWLSFNTLSNTYPLIFYPTIWGLIIFFGFFLGILCCHITGRNLQVEDHSAMVWDEIIAFWLILLFLWHSSFIAQCVAFILFRFFDILKPHPIRYFEQKFRGGFGVMWDDIVAAFYTLLIFAIWRTLFVS
jgi:phosphatidylglycerophosphatase A